MDRMLTDGLWFFDKHVLLLKELAKNEQPSSIQLFYIAFWVKTYDLPLKLQNKDVAKHLGNSIGQFIEMDKAEEKRWDCFIRFKVLLDVHNSLKRGQIIQSI